MHQLLISEENGAFHAHLKAGRSIPQREQNGPVNNQPILVLARRVVSWPWSLWAERIRSCCDGFPQRTGKPHGLFATGLAPSRGFVGEQAEIIHLPWIEGELINE
jgi:hypothetical protein